MKVDLIKDFLPVTVKNAVLINLRKKKMQFFLFKYFSRIRDYVGSLAIGNVCRDWSPTQIHINKYTLSNNWRIQSELSYIILPLFYLQDFLEKYVLLMMQLPVSACMI